MTRRLVWALACAALSWSVWSWQRGEVAGSSALEAGRAALEGAGWEVVRAVAAEEDGGASRVLAEVRRAGGEVELASVVVTVAPSGRPVGVGDVVVLTDSAGASERLEGVWGSAALASVWVDGAVLGLVWLDFAGEPAAVTAGWSWLDRQKSRVTSLQQVGQARGIWVSRVVLAERAAAVEATPSGEGCWRVGLGAGRALELRPSRATNGLEVTGVAARVEVQRKGAQGHLGWAVDTVRDLSWVGAERMGALEHAGLTWLDAVRQQGEVVLGPEALESPLGPPGAAPAPVEVAGSGAGGWAGWPPPPAAPLIAPPGPGEGAWVPMVDGVRAAPDKRPYFYQSWLRPDPERSYARVSVTAWDPERVQLGMVGGTREPVSATGLKGTGEIPRRPGLLPRLVAAFNGGFQSKHGAWGMVVEGEVLTPPAGGGATVATGRSGEVWLGTWPGTGEEPGWRELAKGQPIPAGVLSLRQNLEPLVDGGVVNPTGRRKWGSTAGEHVDATRTTRTGLCRLQGGALAYFYGVSLDAEALGAGMVAYGCDYGIHLDMNAGHSGFEFYQVADDAGERFEAKRMIERMWHMNFPRYIQRDSRDFFYLTLVEPPAERLGRLTGLVWTPVAGFGGAVLEASSGELRLLRLPRGRALLGAEAPEEGSLEVLSLAAAGEVAWGTAAGADGVLLAERGEELLVIWGALEGIGARLEGWGVERAGWLAAAPGATPGEGFVNEAGARYGRGLPVGGAGRRWSVALEPGASGAGRLEALWSAGEQR